MKIIKKGLIVLITSMLFISCASVVEVFDEWEVDKLQTLKNQKIIVLSKSNDKVARERFEKDLADRLRSSGVNAVEGFVAFPELEQKKRTPAEIEIEVKKVIEAGFTGVIVSGVKNKKTLSESSTVGGYDRDVTTGHSGPMFDYFSNYGFGSFYGDSYNSDLGSVYMEAETTTNSYDVYIIEAVTYNLTLPKGEQLVAVLSVKVTDPTSYAEVADKFTKMIAKQFNK